MPLAGLSHNFCTFFGSPSLERSGNEKIIPKKILVCNSYSSTGVHAQNLKLIPIDEG